MQTSAGRVKTKVKGYLVGSEGEREHSPGGLYLADLLLDDQLLVGAVDNFCAGICIQVQLQG